MTDSEAKELGGRHGELAGLNVILKQQVAALRTELAMAQRERDEARADHNEAVKWGTLAMRDRDDARAALAAAEIRERGLLETLAGLAYWAKRFETEPQGVGLASVEHALKVFLVKAEAALAAPAPEPVQRDAADDAAVRAGREAWPVQNQRLYNALAKMFLWQADKVNELMPDELSTEVKALLGEKTVDALVESEKDESYESIAIRARTSADAKPEESARPMTGFDIENACDLDD